MEIDKIQNIIDNIDLDTIKIEIANEDNKIPDIDKTIEDKKKELNDQLSTVDFSLHSQLNGSVYINVSHDKMKVLADFIPPVQNGEPISEKMVYTELYDNKISFGIKEKVISESVKTANLEKKILKNIVIAEGQSPRNEVPEYIEIIINPEDMKKISGKVQIVCQEQNLNVDFKEFSNLCILRENSLVARKHYEVFGSPGQNVYNEEIPFSINRKQSINIGKNISLNEKNGELRTSVFGELILRNSELFVNEVLEIRSDVDFNTGNINFPGDVIVYGNVADGFKIKAGGCLHINKTLDASDVFARNDIVVTNGIIGRNKGIVISEGSICSSFLENVHVESKGNICVKKTILNSLLYTENMIVLPENSRIIGSIIYAQNGINVCHIGSERSKRSEIYCGYNYKARKSIDKIKDYLFQLNKNKKKVLLEIKKTVGKENEKYRAILVKIDEKIAECGNVTAELLTQLDQNEDAEIVVNGRIYPETYIEICKISLIIHHELSHVSFKLDKKSGQIVTTQLQRL